MVYVFLSNAGVYFMPHKVYRLMAIRIFFFLQHGRFFALMPESYVLL
jgi:hypothetical protein